MKLRLLDDSIRLRLSQTDVAAANERGVVEGRTRFPDGSVFTFALEAPRDGSTAAAAYEAARLVVRLPASEVAAWADDDNAISLSAELALPGGESLTLLVEKDFQCLAPREGEDQSDLFVNPEATR
jgi:hypothetical protein